MAVIVRYLENDGDYILLGGGFGAYKSRTPHIFFGNLAPEDRSGEIPVAMICDYKGKIAWVKSDQIRVVSVDGHPPETVLEDAQQLDSDGRPATGRRRSDRR